LKDQITLTPHCDFLEIPFLTFTVTPFIEIHGVMHFLGNRITRSNVFQLSNGYFVKFNKPLDVSV